MMFARDWEGSLHINGLHKNAESAGYIRMCNKTK